jgi:hypothetical protein
MSNIICEQCGRMQIDSERGYIAGCSHYPPEHKRFVDVYFGGEGEAPAKAFFDGAWYRSMRAKQQGRAVHPVVWRESEADDA